MCAAHLVINTILQMLLPDQELVVKDLLTNQQILFKDSPDMLLVCREYGEVPALRLIISLLILIFHFLEQLLDGLLFLDQSALSSIC